MKILRRDRSGDLKGANSPYRIERAAYWTCYFLRHPIRMTFQRPAYARLAADTWVSVLPVYGNPDVPAYSGVQLRGIEIEGDAAGLRSLAALLLDRADRTEAVQALLEAGIWPTEEDREAFPAGFGLDVPYRDLRLGAAAPSGRQVEAS